MENIIYWKDKELVIHDFKQSHVNGGRVEKFWAEDRKTGRIYLLKGSTKFSYEPICEKLAYIIGRDLGVDVLEYDIIPKEALKGIVNIKTFCGYASICEKIDRNNYSIMSIAEIKRAKNIVRGNNSIPITNREVMYEILPKKYIDAMFLFDAIIGNNDRHYGNVHVLRSKNGEIIGAPILDNGASLLANTPLLLAMILGDKVGEIIDRSSTIDDKHYKQIKRATTLNGIKYNIPVKTIEILNDIEPTLKLLPKQRALIVKNYITYRLHKYLGIIKNSEIECNNQEIIYSDHNEKEHT